MTGLFDHGRTDCNVLCLATFQFVLNSEPIMLTNLSEDIRSQNLAQNSSRCKTRGSSFEKKDRQLFIFIQPKQQQLANLIVLKVIVANQQ